MKKFNCVLLVDDDEPTNFLNKLTLKKHGSAEKIITVFDGEQALNYLKNCENVNCPDLILLDINMPSMNGWEFLEEYQKLNHQSKPPVIIMLTTSINPDDEIRSRKFDTIAGFLHKPLKVEELNKFFSN